MASLRVLAASSFTRKVSEKLADVGLTGRRAAWFVTVRRLYLSSPNFYSTFEGWLKGDPEFEVHVLGEEGSTANLKDYQCAGEKAGGAYNYDQNDVNWTGSVLLFSQTQLDQYKAQHPGQALRIVVVEDDDTACVIKTDQTSVQALFQAVDGAYTIFKNGGITLGNVFKAGSVLEKLFAAVASFILTNDDIVGQAVEDVAAAGVRPGDNWIVKGENLVTNGAIRLEMR